MAEATYSIEDLLIGDDDPYDDDFVGIAIELLEGDKPGTVDLRIISAGLDAEDIIAVLTAAINAIEEELEEE